MLNDALIIAFGSGGGGGMENPMTTAGDLILGGADGAPTRLPIGTSGQVLTSDGTTAAWADPSGGGNQHLYEHIITIYHNTSYSSQYPKEAFYITEYSVSATAYSFSTLYSKYGSYNQLGYSGVLTYLDNGIEKKALIYGGYFKGNAQTIAFEIYKEDGTTDTQNVNTTFSKISDIVKQIF